EGGLRRHLERQIEHLAGGRPAEQDALWGLLARLSHGQVDGTITTDLVREADLARRWRGQTAFAEMLGRAESLRLLRVSTRRLDDDTEERSVSLGHDALAKVAAAWRGEREQQEQLRRERKKRWLWTAGAVGGACLAVIFAATGLWALNLMRIAD